MFELSVLKQMKLAELQDIAKLAKIKSAGVKKDLLVQQILEKQNATNTADNVKSTEESVPKRTRIVHSKKQDDTNDANLFSEKTEQQESQVLAETNVTPERKVIKFNKAKYENKINAAAAKKNN